MTATRTWRCHLLRSLSVFPTCYLPSRLIHRTCQLHSACAQGKPSSHFAATQVADKQEPGAAFMIQAHRSKWGCSCVQGQLYVYTGSVICHAPPLSCSKVAFNSPPTIVLSTCCRCWRHMINICYKNRWISRYIGCNAVPSTRSPTSKMLTCNIHRSRGKKRLKPVI